jgi:MFS transporter, DHA2 family, multidrug resistance protein
MSDSATVSDLAASGAPINRTMITFSIMLATIVVALDGTIANVALPHMQGSLNASQDQITWVLTSFIVATAIATPLTGWVTGRFGQKQVFVVSVAGFVIASVLCGLSGSLFEIVVARMLQGVFGASLVPLSQAVLLEINPRASHGRAMAVWGMGVMIGPILGPTLGGWLTDSFDWRWVFFINVPVGAVALWGIWRFIPEAAVRRQVRFDGIGFTLLALSIGALQMFLDRGEQNDWFSSTETWIEIIIAAIAFSAFAIHTWCMPAGQSFFDYRLLLNRNFVTGLLFIFIVGLVLFATRALTPSMLQGLMGFQAIDAGMVTAPSGLGTMLAMMIAGRLTGKVDLRLILGTGFAITAISLLMMCTYTIELSKWDIILPGVVQGFGLGLVFTPLSAAAFSTLPGELRADGTAIYSLLRNIGSSIGIAMVQVLLVRNTQDMHATLASDMNLTNPAFATGGYGQSSSALMGLNAEITRQASMIAYVDNFWLMFILTLLALPLLLLIKIKAADPAEKAERIDVHMD